MRGLVRLVCVLALGVAPVVVGCGESAGNGGAGGDGGTSGMGGDGGTGGSVEPVCGNGTVEGDEDCDDMGESATCNADCTSAECGDGLLNVTAGEDCDGAVANGTCDACLATCDVNYDDCNVDLVADGCEADLTTNATCGTCANACTTGECTDQGGETGFVCLLARANVYPGTTAWNMTENWSAGYWFTQSVILEAGYVNALGVYCDETAGFVNVKFALYTDEAGEPGQLIVSTDVAAQETGEFSTAVASTYVDAGTYWVSAIGESGAVYVEGDNNESTHQTFYYGAAFGAAAPDPWPTGSDVDYGQNPAYSLFAATQPLETP